jgi:hypothetical protein
MSHRDFLRSRTLVAFIAAVAALAMPTRARAHGMRTAYLEVGESTPGRAVVHLRLGAPDPALVVRAPAGCTLVDLGSPRTGFSPDGSNPLGDRARLLDCDGPLVGRTLALSGLGPITSEVVATLQLADGTTATRLVRADAPLLVLAADAAPSPWAVARAFVALGVDHIAAGYDHLLFLLLVVLLLRDVRGVLLAETAFTLSHTIAFSLTALGVVRVSQAAAETCIALSLALLAAEVRVEPYARRWRAAGAALAFGLVHGLGFAGGLREIGLPDHAIGAALVGFGAGIEIGQVAFLAIVLVAFRLARRWPALPRAQLAAAYAIGCFAAFLTIARAAS